MDLPRPNDSYIYRLFCDLYQARGYQAGPAGSVPSRQDSTDPSACTEYTDGLEGLTREEGNSGTIPADEIILSSPHGVSWRRRVGGQKMPEFSLLACTLLDAVGCC